MANQFDLQPSFPIAGVADLLANRPVKEAQMRAQQQQQLVQGLQGFGAGVQQLVDRRNQMAQALAQAQVYAQTPEGQQMMAPTQAPTPGFGAQLPPDAQGPAGPTTATPSPIDMNTLATAFKGATPENFLSNIQSQQATKKAYDLEGMKEANALKLGQARLQTMKEIFQGGLAPKYAEIGEREKSNIRNQITQLESKKAQAIKDFPEIAGTFISGLLPEGANAKEAAAFKDYQNTQKQIDGYNRQLYGSSGGSSSGPASHASTADLLAIAQAIH